MTKVPFSQRKNKCIYKITRFLPLLVWLWIVNMFSKLLQPFRLNKSDFKRINQEIILRK